MFKYPNFAYEVGVRIIKSVIADPKSTIMKIRFIYYLVLTLISGTVICQTQNPDKIEVGERVTIHSKILNESRELFIYSPKTSSSKKVSYPVIYLLDAESLFIPAVGAIHFLNYSSYLPQMPEAYIVGIVNTKRDRDMPVPREIEKSEGIQNFYSFLSQELVPYINKNFSASGLNILIGHSQGGLFATYAAVQNPKLFPFVLAMDAPMEVVTSVKQMYSEKLLKCCGLKYVSAESIYGWRNSMVVNNSCLLFSQVKIEGESHETMPYKGLYEGLKILFSDYWPSAKDLSLEKLSAYYNLLERKYNVPYLIPSRALLESAKQNIGQSNKTIALELLAENEKIYGVSPMSQALLVKANAIEKGPDERVKNALSHASPTDEEVTPFLGNWTGIVKVPDGTDTPIDWEIKKVAGKYIMESDVMKQFKTQSDFLFVNEKKELVWGRKHDGGGIYISIGVLSTNGLIISGTEDLIGFEFPPNMPAFKKNTFRFQKR